MYTHSGHLCLFSQRTFTNIDLHLLQESWEAGRGLAYSCNPDTREAEHIKFEASRSYIARPHLKRGGGEPCRD